MEKQVFDVMDVGVLAPNIVDVVVKTQEEIKRILDAITPLCDVAFVSEDKSIVIMKSGVIILVRRPRVVQTVR